MADPKVETVVDPEQAGLEIWGPETKKEEPKEKQEPPKKEEPPKEPEKPKEEEVKAPEKETHEPTEEEKAKAEEERILNAKEEELSEEDKTKKVEILKKQDEAKQKAFDDEVAAYAKEHGMSVDEAKADFDSIAKIHEKYKGDAKQLAQANLHLQRLYTKTQDELKKAKETPPEPPRELSDENIEKLIDDGKVRIKGKSATKEQLIEAYRLREPKLTATADNETVFSMVLKETRRALEIRHQEMLIKMDSDAKDKKAKLLNDLPDDLKKYVPDIKPILDSQPSAHILGEEFDLSFLIQWAKGKDADEREKLAEERGYKRGLEQAKILGEKAAPKVPPVKPAPKSTKRILTEEQKKEALEMFHSMIGVTDEYKFDAYIELLEADEARQKK